MSLCVNDVVSHGFIVVPEELTHFHFSYQSLMVIVGIVIVHDSSSLYFLQNSVCEDIDSIQYHVLKVHVTVLLNMAYKVDHVCKTYCNEISVQSCISGVVYRHSKSNQSLFGVHREVTLLPSIAITAECHELGCIINVSNSGFVKTFKQRTKRQRERLTRLS